MGSNSDSWDNPKPGSGILLDAASADILFPMHVVLGPDGRIKGVGRTLIRVLGSDPSGKMFDAVFTIKKPRNIQQVSQLHAIPGQRFILEALTDDPVGLRCISAPVGADLKDLLIEASFASDLLQSLKTHGLTNSDFRANDPALDLVISLEAQQAILEDAQKMAKALSEAKRIAEQKADRDPVTGLANRRGLQRWLSRQQLECSDALVSVLLHIDLNKFKSVNDTFGHAAGDKILDHVARVIAEFAGLQEPALAARIGGDEFAVIVKEGEVLSLCQVWSQSIIDKIRQPIRFENQTLSVGASIGLVQFHPAHGADASNLLSQSDIALYSSKASDHDITVLTADMLSEHKDRQKLIGEIERGIDENQFVPHFQPQVDTSTGDVIGLEVVARWLHPKRGLLYPGDFIEVAMRANLMQQIDAIVRKSAIAQFSAWNTEGLQARRLSLNLTAANLRAPEFLEELLDELMAAGLSPDSVRLEMLESILFDSGDETIQIQSKRLKDAGFALALDDFGTGHASISTLLMAPISTLKIDRRFVTGIDNDHMLQRITGSIIAMADQLGLAVIAEGVERAEEVELLQRFGCHLFQGFYFGRALDADATRAWLRDWTAEAPDSKASFR